MTNQQKREEILEWAILEKNSSKLAGGRWVREYFFEKNP